MDCRSVGVGQYEKLRGRAFGELEPLKRQNEVITDISLAPRNATGKVEYSMDILILKPINLGKGNHRILLDMNNRGELRLARLNEVSSVPLNPPLTNDPSTKEDAGTGFVMSQGYTVVGNGWDVGAEPATGGSMTISLPTARFPAGSATTDITGPSYEYLVNDSAGAAARTQPRPAATTAVRRMASSSPSRRPRPSARRSVTRANRSKSATRTTPGT